MPSHNILIKNAFARSVRPGTALQDAVFKVRHSRRKSQTEFEIALGELFVLSSDAFKARNGYRNEVAKLKKRVAELEEELKWLTTSQSQPGAART